MLKGVGYLSLLVFLAILPIVMGSRVNRSSEPVLQLPSHLLKSGELRDVEVTLTGEDSSRMRLSAALLRLEAATTAELISTSKAVVAHDVTVCPVDALLPEWRFGRVQIWSERGPYEWFGPAQFTPLEGEPESHGNGRGAFSIVRGNVELDSQAK